ncbi:hypothetical protein [Pseudomonas mandelii]|uniref:hypothetical protein n=1 Tax=Pseudomonas mandelii TaxID=75612 RepID=UPI003C7493CE
MKLIQCRFSSGQRVPLLVHAGNAAPLPIVIPFIYVQLKLRYRVLGIHAVTLFARSYLVEGGDLMDLLERVTQELHELQ